MMSYKEKDIVYENAHAWVLKRANSYTVFLAGVTYSVTDSAYAPDNDGLSLAKARCDYLARREARQ